MADVWNDASPDTTHVVASDITSIYENFQSLKNLLSYHYKTWPTKADCGIAKGAMYFVDPAATDQALTYSASLRSVYDLITPLSTSKYATLVFLHNPVAGNTTTYTWKTNQTIPSNVAVLIEPGVVLDATGKTLTINGPVIAPAGIGTQLLSAGTFVFGMYQHVRKPAFLASSNTASNVTGDGSAYVMQWGTGVGSVLYDHDSSFNTGTGRFTAKIAGVYHFSASVEAGGFTSEQKKLFSVSLRTNGADGTIYQTDVRPVLYTDSVTSMQITVSGDYRLSVGDYVYVYTAVSGTTKNVSINASTFFSGHMVTGLVP